MRGDATEGETYDWWDVTLRLGGFSGPFPARLEINAARISVLPFKLPLLRRLRSFQPRTALAHEVSWVEEDRWSRYGFKIRTTTGALDQLGLVPDTRRDRLAISRSLRRHGYAVR